MRWAETQHFGQKINGYPLLPTITITVTITLETKNAIQSNGDGLMILLVRTWRGVGL